MYDQFEKEEVVVVVVVGVGVGVVEMGGNESGVLTWYQSQTSFLASNKTSLASEEEA